ncbi:hypothetical protein EfmAA94_05380 [Enterococcus faecium]|nr:hypothetical protein EfmAA94_05380 [Enterococcus faecium]
MLSFFIEEFFNSASPLNVSKGNGIKQYCRTVSIFYKLCFEASSGGLYKYEINTKNGKKLVSSNMVFTL